MKALAKIILITGFMISAVLPQVAKADDLKEYAFIKELLGANGEYGQIVLTIKLESQKIDLLTDMYIRGHHAVALQSLDLKTNVLHGERYEWYNGEKLYAEWGNFDRQLDKVTGYFMVKDVEQGINSVTNGDESILSFLRKVRKEIMKAAGLAEGEVIVIPPANPPVGPPHNAP